MLFAVLCGYLFALLAPFFVRLFKAGAGPALSALPAFLTAYFLQFVPEAAAGRPWRFAYPWGGPGGIEAVFWVDSLSLLFALLVTTVSAAVLFASASVELGERARARMLFSHLSLLSSALGLIFAATPALIMGFSVLASLSAYLLFTSEHGARARASRVPMLIGLLAGDFLLIAALAGLFLGSAAAAAIDLASHPPTDSSLLRVAGAMFILSGLTRFLMFRSELAKPGGAIGEGSALLIYVAYVPLLLYLALRLGPVLAASQSNQILLGLSGGAMLVIGALTGLRARSLRTLLGGASLVILALALLQLASFSAGGETAALLLVTAHAFGIGALLLAAQGIGSRTLLADLPSVLGGRWLTRALFIMAGVALAGLLPSLGMLALAKSLEAGTTPSFNPAAIIFMTAGHGVLIALLGRPILRLIRAPKAEADSKRTLWRTAAGLFCAFVMSIFLLALGWWPAILDRLFVDPITARLAPMTPIGPFWPNGLALPLAAIALIFASLALVLERRIAAALDWLGVALPRRPERLWSAALGALKSLSRLGAEVLTSLGVRGFAAAIAVMLGAVFIWVLALTAQSGITMGAIDLLPDAAIGVLCALTAILITLQSRFERAGLLVTIGGLLAVLAVLFAGVVDLAYLLVLLWMLEAGIVFLLASRLRSGRADGALPRSARAGIALIIGCGAAVLSLKLPEIEIQSTSWTRLDQLQLWSAVLVVLLIFGVVFVEVSRAERRAP